MKLMTSLGFKQKPAAPLSADLKTVCDHLETLGFQLWWEDECPTTQEVTVAASHVNDPSQYMVVGTNPNDYYGTRVCSNEGREVKHVLPRTDLQTINTVAALVFGVDVP